MEKKCLLLVLPNLGIISSKTKTKLQKALKSVLNCCKLEIAFKCQTSLSNSFWYKHPIPKDFISDVVYKFQCGLCNESYYDKIIRYLDKRFGEHLGVSPRTEKKVKPSNHNAVCDHLLTKHFLPSFEIKESLLIMRHKPSLNRNINSAPLHFG